MRTLVVLSAYAAGTALFLTGLIAISARLIGFWIEAPVELLIVVGFALMIGAKVIAHLWAKEE